MSRSSEKRDVPNSQKDISRSPTEKKLSQALEAPGSLSAEEIRNLLQDLRPYVTELEQQNEALRKDREESLPQNEKWFRELIDRAPVGYVFIDRQGLFQYVNSAWLKMHGYDSADEVIGRHFSLTQNDPDTAASQRIVEQLLSGETIPTGEFSRRCRDGSIGYHTFSVHPVVQAEKIVGLEGFLIDTTQRKLAEEALHKKDAMLARIATQVPGMIYQFMKKPDGSLSVPYSSEGVMDVFGCTPEQVRNDFEPIFKAIHPEDHDKILRTIDESAENMTQWMCEYRVQLPGRPVKWIFGNSIPEKLADGSILWSGYNMDITERKKAEEERKKLQDQLTQAQKMESIGRLAGGVAHDFNNMLSVILGYAELAMDKVGQSHPISIDLLEIHKAAERSMNITRQLLAFARRQTIAPIALDLNETIEDMLKMLRQLIGEDIELAWFPGAHVWPIRIDPSQIDHLLANLCVNARDAITGVGKITIETKNISFDEEYCATHAGFLPGEYVMLAVSDDGIGMAPETLENLFEPFFTTKEASKGTGLGLATVYGIVKQNNGFINVYSEPEKGTTFKIYLSRHIANGENTQIQDRHTHDTIGSETILLVEDEPSLLDMTKMILERLGYTVIEAGTPETAIELARDHAGEIHLLVTDVIMPEMNGRDLSDKLLALYPNLKCLFMSGYTANVIAHHGVLDEGVNFLQKPFTKQQLAVKIRAVLDTGQ